MCRWSARFLRTPPASGTVTRGFTLVEMLITLVILALLLAAASPSFADFFDKARLRGAADDLATLYSKARTDAVKRGRDVTVAATAGWCFGANEAPDRSTANAANPVPASAACDCTAADACFVDFQRRVVASANYSGVSPVGALPGNLVFDGKLGNVSDLTARSLTLASPSGKFRAQLEISPLGQTRICTPTGYPAVGGYPPC
jgi:type IV fimbrial biogenesis protein FimT